MYEGWHLATLDKGRGRGIANVPVEQNIPCAQDTVSTAFAAIYNGAVGLSIVTRGCLLVHFLKLIVLLFSDFQDPSKCAGASFYCELCEVKLANLDSCKNHIRSKVHKKLKKVGSSTELVELPVRSTCSRE